MPNDEHSQNVPPAPRPYKIDLSEVSPESADKGQKKPPWDLGFNHAPATRFLILANIAVFGLMVLTSGGEAFLDPSGKTLVDFGADYGPLTLNGEYWRLLTNIFVHVGIVHIGMNMFVLSQIGDSLEFLYGRSKFVVIYLIAGVTGSLASIIFNPNVLSAGASGAVFGSYGALLALYRAHYNAFNRDWINASTRAVLFLIVFNLIWGFTRPNIDNAAHIGGFVGGVFAGLALLPRNLGDHRWTKRNVIGVISLILGILAGAKITL